MESTTIKNNQKLLSLTLALTTTALSLIPFQVSAKPSQEFRYNSSKAPSSLNHTKQNNGSYRPYTPYPSNNIPNSPVQNSGQITSLNIGTIIPATYPEANKILVTKEETMALVLTVTTNVRDNNNRIIIPSGSQIVGEIIPDGNGSRFVGNTLILNNGSEYEINTSSRVITTTETVSAGKNTDAIWQGALAGTGAAAIITGITGDNRITPLELLGGASIGALGGLILGGDRTQELISIDPQRDFDLTLNSSFSINNTNNTTNNSTLRTW
jgi:hypothetical protein